MSKNKLPKTPSSAGKGNQNTNQTFEVHGSSVLAPDINSHIKSIYTKIKQIRGIEPDKSPPKTINWTDIDDELTNISEDYVHYKRAFESIKQAFDKIELNKADNGVPAKVKTGGSGAQQTNKPKASTSNSGGKKAAASPNIDKDIKEIKDNIQYLKSQITSLETERSGQQTLLKEIKESIIYQNNTAVLNQKVKPREKDHKTNRDTGTGRQTRSNQTQQTKDKVSLSSEDNCHDLISFISMETKQMSVEITELRSVLEKVHETIDGTKTGPAKVENRKDAPPLQPQMVLQELTEYIKLKTVRDRDEDDRKKKEKEALLAKTNKKDILENSHIKSIYTKIKQIRGIEPDKSPPKTINWTDIDDELTNISEDYVHYKRAFESIKQAFDKIELNKADNGVPAKVKTGGSGAQQTNKPKASTSNSGGKKAAASPNIDKDIKEIKDNIQYLKSQITSLETERSGQQTLLKEIKESIIYQNNTAVLNQKVKPREKDHKTNRDTGTGRQTRSNQTQQTKDKVSLSSEDNCHDLISFISMETKQMSVEITELRSVLEKVHETIDGTKTGPAKVENRKDAPPLQPQMVLQELTEYIKLKTVRDRDEDDRKKKEKEALLAKTNKKDILEMNTQDRKTLTRNYKILVERTPIESMIEDLIKSHILNDETGEFIMSKPTHKGRNRAFYEVLPRRGRRAFEILCDILISHGCDDLVEGMRGPTLEDLDVCYPDASSFDLENDTKLIVENGWIELKQGNESIGFPLVRWIMFESYFNEVDTVFAQINSNRYAVVEGHLGGNLYLHLGNLDYEGYLEPKVELRFKTLDGTLKPQGVQLQYEQFVKLRDVSKILPDVIPALKDTQPCFTTHQNVEGAMWCCECYPGGCLGL